jgi:ADP-dependent phosphofructokinase/glucokinase
MAIKYNTDIEAINIIKSEEFKKLINTCNK